MPFLDVLVHEARKHCWTTDRTEWVDGEYKEVEVFGPKFDCCLFLPQGTETSAGRGRQVREPTLLFEPEDQQGGLVALKPEDELLVRAPELNVAEGRPENEEVRWMVNGAAQPFGKPGQDVIGFQVTLRRVEG